MRQVLVGKRIDLREADDLIEKKPCPWENPVTIVTREDSSLGFFRQWSRTRPTLI